jgi:hypothetical protein
VDQFIDEAITVEADETTQPKSFVWRGVRYEVMEVLKVWQDWHTPSFAKHAKGWIHRRHRNCFVVRTAGDEIFELYLDRGSGKRDWILFKRQTTE